ncbi:MAG: NADH-quinone oxidoreductase subunit L, partial [Chloroflexi bacterium]|nr:NADH-quinone oxidoreductase subunit L [Chloroflexota bacterium]
MFDYVWVIPAAPLAAAVINGVLGRRLGKATAAFGIAAVAISFVMALYIASVVLGAPEGARQPLADAPFYQWIVSGSFQVQLGYYIDPLAS